MGSGSRNLAILPPPASINVNRASSTALAEGKLVLCDRFADSTLVYQG